MTDFTYDSIPVEQREAFNLWLLDKWMYTFYIKEEYDEFKRQAAYPETTPEPETETETCCVCLTEDATKLCPTGGHHYACDDCWEKLRLGTDARCPVCRASGVVDLIEITVVNPIEVTERRPIQEYNFRVYHTLPTPIFDYPVCNGNNMDEFVINIVNYIDANSNGMAFHDDYEKREVAMKLVQSNFHFLKEIMNEGSLIILIEQCVHDRGQDTIYFGFVEGLMVKFSYTLVRGAFIAVSPAEVFSKRLDTMRKERFNLRPTGRRQSGKERFITKRRGYYTKEIFWSEDRRPWRTQRWVGS